MQNRLWLRATASPGLELLHSEEFFFHLAHGRALGVRDDSIQRERFNTSNYSRWQLAGWRVNLRCKPSTMKSEYGQRYVKEPPCLNWNWF
jgi:hypothetical protein